ncbi:MAG: prenyltransferase/squalene oxidase repeat-containing protein [Gammaproteobacteria bacterium]
MTRFITLALLLLVSDSLPAAAGPDSESQAARAAVSKSLPLLQEIGPKFWAGSGCFSCHNNTLPDIAVSIARQGGFTIDEATVALSRKQTLDWLDLRKDRMLEGLPPAGGQNTMGSALFSLALTKAPPTETLYAGARFLKLLQTADGSWQVQNHRPPLVASSISLTAMSLLGLRAYAPPSQKAEYGRHVDAAVSWLARANPLTTEDLAFKILGLSWGDGSRRTIAATAGKLIAQQRDDGGWSQLPALDSDSYATGQALVALHEAGIPAGAPVYRKGVRFLVETQLSDGSWHVKTRSEPSQTYFESGYPHGVDQFISAAGASWATAALALTQPLASTLSSRAANSGEDTHIALFRAE